MRVGRLCCEKEASETGAAGGILCCVMRFGIGIGNWEERVVVTGWGNTESLGRERVLCVRWWGGEEAPNQPYHRMQLLVLTLLIAS